jgi:Ca2+-binding EF-hand superfamily protein
LDVNHTDDLSVEELSNGLRSLPHLNDLEDNQIAALMKILDKDGNNRVTMEEFISFVNMNYNDENFRGEPLKEMKKGENMKRSLVMSLTHCYCRPGNIT